MQPGRDAKLQINVSCPNSDIALLAVDKGLYILNNKNRLSRNKVTETVVHNELRKTIDFFRCLKL